MPLHTSYRPDSLEDIVGNSSAVKALRVHLSKESPNRSILLIGPAGCGKSTIGYCIAREVGALDDKVPWNFKELNASDDRGIDVIREIKDAARRRPIGHSSARVWLFEEAHMMTKEAKESLLKLLEEPPKLCWFVFTTTDPGKLFSGLKDPNALKRRFTEFQVEPVSDRDMRSLLFKILKAEGKRVPNDVLARVIQDSLGSPGMALNLLDKIIDLPEEDMAAAVKRWVEQSNTVATLFNAIIKKSKWPEVCEILKGLNESGGYDAESLRREILAYTEKVFLGGEKRAYLIMRTFLDADCYRNGSSALTAAIYEALFVE